MALAAPRPRVLFVGTVRFDLPLSGAAAAKWSALGEHIDWRVVGRRGRVSASDERFALIGWGGPQALEAAWFHLTLARRVRRSILRWRPSAVIAQSPYEGAHVLRAVRRVPTRPRVIVEVHADWRTATRSYGSAWRRPLARVADRVAVASLHRADAIRTVSRATTGLVRDATGRAVDACFPAFVDGPAFVDRPPAPLPRTPVVLWVGALQPVKGFPVLARAWPEIAERSPAARLLIVGDGPQRPLADRLASQWRGRVDVLGVLPEADVPRVMDQATVLVMPSQSEAYGRAALEAMARGRPVVASAVGGLLELVEDGATGLLVPAGDAPALARAALRILDEPSTAAAMAASARARAMELAQSAPRYAAATVAMVTGSLSEEGTRDTTLPPT